MKFIHLFLNFFKLIISISLIGVPLMVHAKEISLFEQPKNDAKVVAKVDLSSGIIPIYTPKEGGWTKIADPKNGNVGWVKSIDITNAGASQSIIYTQSIVNDHSSPTYRVIQFGQPTNLTPEQTQNMVKTIQNQQQAIQQSMEKLRQNMNQFFYDEWNLLNTNHFPFVMPVMVIPEQKNMKVVKPVSSDKQQSLPKSLSPSSQQPSEVNNTTAIKK